MPYVYIYSCSCNCLYSYFCNYRYSMDFTSFILNKLVYSLVLSIAKLHFFSDVSDIIYPKQTDCPENFTKHSIFCYKHYDTSLTFEEALTACRKDGSSLPVIRNEEMYDALNNILENLHLKSVWLGLSKDAERNWFWADGLPYNNELLSKSGFSWYRHGRCYLLYTSGLYRYDCRYTHQTLCVKWVSQVKPLQVVVQQTIPNSHLYSGIYKPLNGILYGGTAFYSQGVPANDFSIYFVKRGNRFFIWQNWVTF